MSRHRHRSGPFKGKAKRQPRSNLHRAKHTDADFDAAPTVEATIERLSDKGDGVAMVDDQPVFVPYTATGDLVTFKRVDGHGRLMSVVSPGPDRHAATYPPPCVLFGDCGGCSFQHLTRAAEDLWKQSLVMDALLAEGIAAPPLSLAPRLPVAARRRVTLSAQRHGADVVVGFRAKRSHRIVPMTMCAVVTPALFAVIEQLPQVLHLLPRHWNTLTIRLTQCDNGFDLDISDVPNAEIDPMVAEEFARAARMLDIIRVAINGVPIITHEAPMVLVDDIPVAIPPGAFLQASRAGQESLIDLVAAGLSSFAIKPGALVADLFSGCGTFSLPITRHHQVYAADNDAPGIDALVHAHRHYQGLKPLTANARDLCRQPLLADELNRFTAIVLDPPRAGAPAEVKQIAESTVPCLVYVSCNPKSFARDARLLAKGGFTLQALTLVDQFAHSPHVEVVGVFGR
ncbi:MAG: TRAM domain-containing protein [Pseudomonadota bacterium]